MTALGLAIPMVVFLARKRINLPWVLYWPSAVSAALLFAFGRTLVSPPPMVERFARLQKPDLGKSEIVYCRRVTQLWCLFFLANGVAAMGLALASSLKAWALYTGLISYFLIGILFSGEYLYRHWIFRPEGALLTGWMNRWHSQTRRS